MKWSWAVAVLVVLMGIWGCEPTPYQRAGISFGQGFSEKKLARDIFHVEFRANLTTFPKTLLDYLYRRAAELTLQHGFRYFAVIREPRPLVEYRTEYRSQEDEEARIDGMEAEFPAWGTMQMAIQCFPDGRPAATTSLIDAEAYLAQNRG